LERIASRLQEKAFAAAREEATKYFILQLESKAAAFSKLRPAFREQLHRGALASALVGFARTDEAHALHPR